MLPLVFAIVALAAVAVVLLPLLRGVRASADRGSYDRAVYRDQLSELDRDIARGLLTDAEAAGARLEIQRRLLATGAPGPGQRDAGTKSRPNPVLAAAVAIAIATTAASLYALLGSPGLPDQPYASRNSGTELAGKGQHIDLRAAAVQLRERLMTDAKNADGWLLYARTEAMLGDWDKAVDAFSRARKLGRTGPEIDAAYGEMLVMQQQGIVSPAARDVFLSALKEDPGNEVARYYLALADEQAGEAEKAIARFMRLAADLPADSPMRGEIGRRIAETAASAGLPAPDLPAGRAPEPAGSGPGPDAAAMEAASRMPPAERAAMIQGMVAKLTERLKSEPDNLDGWLRLGRAYTVLGQRDKAAEAYQKAEALRPDDVGIRLQELGALLQGLRPGEKMPDRAPDVLRQVQAAAPERPEVLWYAGIVALHSGHPDVAQQSWTRLLAKLPANGEGADMVKAALEQVRNAKPQP